MNQHCLPVGAIKVWKVLTADKQAPPLLPVAASSLFDAGIQLGVCLIDVDHDLFALLIDLLDLFLLLHNILVYLCKELSELLHLSFNFLDSFMSALYGSECRLCLAASVALEQLSHASASRYFPR